ncbi:HAMP domain-containing histidine kinase [Shewanella submarina]|uniref:histidine kinase n=1 Tax=Shewanella submarina TaxID=2016376 RepID=A0ABV7GF31_9GAMM|nr:HAMP domain-containing sensor histidine kinase [Shewanella submarina]MCL1035790.1 HAMP domain-containing histidine kinase [Shewanella submarina]
MITLFKQMLENPDARRLTQSVLLIVILLTLLVTLLQTGQKHSDLISAQNARVERAVTQRLPTLFDNLSTGDVTALPSLIKSWLSELSESEELEYASLTMGNNLSWQHGDLNGTPSVSLSLGDSKTLPAAKLLLQPNGKLLRQELWQAFWQQLLFNGLLLLLAASAGLIWLWRKVSPPAKTTKEPEKELPNPLELQLSELQSKLKQVETERDTLQAREQKYQDNLSLKDKEHSKELEQSMMLLNRAQQLMVEQEKMAALGGLVSGLAHELNTPIGVCLTASTMVKNELEELHLLINGDEPTLDEINSIIADTQQSCELATGNIIKASQLVQKFKTVAVAQPQDKQQDLNLLQAVEDLYDSTRLMYKPKEANIEINIAPNLEIVCNHSLLSQIVGNLLTNAFSHGFTKDKGNRLLVSATIEDEQLKISVEDNGPGISSDVAEHMFEPFYTTSRSNGATGLGLAAAYNATTQLQGTIWFNHHTSLGGAGFVVQFPVQYRLAGDIELYQC